MKNIFLLLLFLSFCALTQAQDLKPELKIQIGHTGAINQIVMLPDGKSFLTASTDRTDNTIKLWDIESGKEIRTFQGHSTGVKLLVPLPDNKRFFADSWGGTCRALGYRNGQENPEF